MENSSELPKLKERLAHLEAENELLKRQISKNHKINELFERSNDLLAVSNIKGRFVRINPAFTKLLGYTQTELIGQKFVEFLHEDDYERSRHAMKTILGTNKPLVQFENRLRTKDLKYVWLEWNAIRDDENGLVYSVARDITQTKIREERLLMMEAAIANSNDCVLITDAVGFDDPYPKIIYCNEAFTRMTGYSREEIIGKTPRVLQGPNTDSVSRQRIRTALETWSPIETDILNYRKDGTPFWVNLSIVPIVDDSGWYTYWVSIQRDVTDRVNYKEKLEQEVLDRTAAFKRSNEKLEHFASVASHDLKAPLRQITSYLQLLKYRSREKLGPDEMAYLEHALKNASNAYELIEGVLKYSLVRADHQERTDVDLNIVLDEILDLFRESIESKHISISSTRLPTLFCNRVQVKQLFQNLIGNALKFSNSNVPAVSIRAIEIENGYQFEVIDNGIGIHHSDVDDIFSLFGRAKNTGDQSGQGLGLAICKEIVNNHNGEIWVDTELGIGTSFIFTLLAPVGELAAELADHSH